MGEVTKMKWFKSALGLAIVLHQSSSAEFFFSIFSHLDASCCMPHYTDLLTH